MDLPFKFVNVERFEPENRSSTPIPHQPFRIPYTLTDDKGRKWRVIIYTDHKDMLEYRDYPPMYKDMAGRKQWQPLWKKINKYIVDTIKLWDVKQRLKSAGMSEEEAEKNAPVIIKI
jgi:hypothetical protein